MKILEPFAEVTELQGEKYATIGCAVPSLKALKISCKINAIIFAFILQLSVHQLSL